MESYQNLKTKNFYILSLTKIGEKIKEQIAKPTETVIICAQQNVEIAGGLNLIQIETEDDRILNMLKRYKNAVYRLTPIGLLLPASLKNNTEQIFITCRELNNIKKALINCKIYGSLEIMDLKIK